MTSTRIALGAWAVLASMLAGCRDRDQDKGNTAMKGSVRHLNPDGLHKKPAYSQAVVVAGKAKTVYVGGQNAVDTSGQVEDTGAARSSSLEQTMRSTNASKPCMGAPKTMARG